MRDLFIDDRWVDSTSDVSRAQRVAAALRHGTVWIRPPMRWFAGADGGGE